MKDIDLIRYSRPARAGAGKRSRSIKIANTLLLLLLAISTAALVLILYVSGILSKFQYDDQFTQDDAALGVYKSYEDRITNIALFGVDQRGNESSRSDSIMVMTIDGKNNKVKLSSFMRDSRVEIEGHGLDKLGHAYMYGGPELAVKTLNQNFKLDIRNYVTVNFSQLADIVDAVGGVEIEVKDYEVKQLNKLIRDQRSLGINGTEISSAGLQTLDGPQALAYARIRKAGNGDFERTDRQRQVLQSIFNKALSLKPLEYPRAANMILPHVTTSLSLNECLGFAGILSQDGVKMEDLRFPLKKDYEGSGTATIGGISYVVFDIEATADSVRQFIFDDINPEEEPATADAAKE